MEIYDGDNRFEIIAKAKEDLINSTNIETSPDEMKVLDNFLFRCWQMDWLDKYDKKLEQPDKCKCVKDADCCYPIEDCNNCPNHKENDTSDLELIIGYMSAIRKMIKGTQMDVSLFINSDENFPIAHINFLNDETGRLVKHITCNVDDEEEDYIWNGEGD
jgi:hypothetical protein